MMKSKAVSIKLKTWVEINDVCFDGVQKEIWHQVDWVIQQELRNRLRLPHGWSIIELAQTTYEEHTMLTAIQIYGFFTETIGRHGKDPFIETIG